MPGFISRNLKSIRGFLSPDQVSYLIFYVTNRCNFKCDFCFYYAETEKGRKPNEMSVDDIRKFSEKLGPVFQLSLTGGEPFLRDELAEIAGIFIRNNYVRYLTIPTNAYLTDRIVAFLERVLPEFPGVYFRIPFSIEAIGDEHDRIRSKPGSFQKILETYEAVKPLRERFGNIVIDSNSVFSSATQDSLRATLETLHKDFDFDNLSVTYARGEIKDESLKRSSFEKYIAINDFLADLPKKKEKRFLYPAWRAVNDVSREYLVRAVLNDEFIVPCTAGRKLLVVYETGDVHACEILKKSMGRLQDFNFDIKKLLAEKSNAEFLEWIKKSKCKCSFECALAANVLWGRGSMGRLVKRFFKNIGRKQK